ncbi:hypothetical protein [Bernardetia sp.]|uniref:hypothetical protein n=1 Tax=Bernardetia sp. TaxID=1937974 RepID=UPI0025B9C6ED|nr:hypothetical protein [Bernardetia sp.]
MTAFRNDKTENVENKKIAILSVLKPVDDVRAYKKIAKSVVGNHKKITLIGFEASSFSKKNNTEKNIEFIELFSQINHGNRLGLWRFFAGFRVLYQLLKIKPHTIIVCAVELLPFTLLYKFFFKTKLIYDMQENYVFNILYQENYPRFLKKPLAFLIRNFEKFSSRFIDLYLLAERCYLEEIPFLKKQNYIFLENKFLIEDDSDFERNSIVPSDFLTTKNIKFLLYGSFSKTYGTVEGILFFKKLQKEFFKKGIQIQLVLAGYCSDKNYSKKITELIKNEPSISLLNNSVSTPISHKILLEKIQKTDFVILPYLFNRSTQNCIPTKFYECLAYQKPMLFSKNEKWKFFLEPLHAGFSVDFESQNLENEAKIVVKKIIAQQFYSKPIDESIWRFDRSSLSV